MFNECLVYTYKLLINCLAIYILIEAICKRIFPMIGTNVFATKAMINTLKENNKNGQEGRT